MALTGSLVVVTQALVDKLTNNMVALGLGAVYYGDQERITTTPVACVEPVNKQNNLDMGAASRLLNPVISVTIILYHSAVASTQSNRHDADAFAEAIETFVNIDRTLNNGVVGNDIIIHGYVTGIESGYVTKGNTVMRASKINYSAISRIILPS